MSKRRGGWGERKRNPEKANVGHLHRYVWPNSRPQNKNLISTNKVIKKERRRGPEPVRNNLYPPMVSGVQTPAVWESENRNNYRTGGILLVRRLLALFLSYSASQTFSWIHPTERKARFCCPFRPSPGSNKRSNAPVTGGKKKKAACERSCSQAIDDFKYSKGFFAKGSGFSLYKKHFKEGFYNWKYQTAFALSLINTVILWVGKEFSLDDLNVLL